MCVRLKQSWWCKQLFVIPIIVMLGISLITAHKIDQAAKVGPQILTESFHESIRFTLDHHKQHGFTEDFMLDLATSVDSIKGFAGGLYTSDGKELYEFNKIYDPDQPDMPEQFVEGLLKTVELGKSGTKIVRSNSIPGIKHHRLDYVTVGNYTLIWSIRPDYNDIYIANFHSFNWWILGGMFFNTITILITFIIFRRYHIFYNKRVRAINMHNKDKIEKLKNDEKVIE